MIFGLLVELLDDFDMWTYDSAGRWPIGILLEMRLCWILSDTCCLLGTRVMSKRNATSYLRGRNAEFRRCWFDGGLSQGLTESSHTRISNVCSSTRFFCFPGQGLPKCPSFVVSHAGSW